MSRREPVPRFALTDTDRLLIGHLRLCSFPIASFAKRFARNMGHLVDAHDGRISAKERACLCSLVWRFRRQISTAIVAKAGIYLAELQAAYQLDKVAQPVATVPSTAIRNAAEDLFARQGQ
jgi:hypothetical protein